MRSECDHCYYCALITDEVQATLNVTRNLVYKKTPQRALGLELEMASLA